MIYKPKAGSNPRPTDIGDRVTRCFFVKKSPKFMRNPNYFEKNNTKPFLWKRVATKCVDFKGCPFETID
jgi:hypothetical protein